MLRAYWKRCAASATGFAREYRLDPFLRTEVNVVFLQILFSLAVVGLMGAALALLYQTTLTSILAHVQENIANMPQGASGRILAVPTFPEIQSGPLVSIIAASVGLMLVFGYLMVRIALAPTKSALASQKQFVGNVAHELRTPLAILRANNDLRLMDPRLEKEARVLLESNTEELERLSEIINNLLTLNTLVRPEHIKFAPVDVADVADEALKKFTHLLRQKHLVVTEKRAGNTLVVGNRTALVQIAVNIIKNATLYTPQGGAIDVLVEADYRGSVTFSVKDSGPGIAEKDLAHIFEPYYRGDASRTRKTGGSGLGLAIVSELTRLHRGSVKVQSAPGRGTSVVVSLPASENGVRPNEVGVDFSA